MAPLLVEVGSEARFPIFSTLPRVTPPVVVKLASVGEEAVVKSWSKRTSPVIVKLPLAVAMLKPVAEGVKLKPLYLSAVTAPRIATSPLTSRNPLVVVSAKMLFRLPTTDGRRLDDVF